MPRLAQGDLHVSRCPGARHHHARPSWRRGCCLPSMATRWRVAPFGQGHAGPPPWLLRSATPSSASVLARGAQRAGSIGVGWPPNASGRSTRTRTLLAGPGVPTRGRGVHGVSVGPGNARGHEIQMSSDHAPGLAPRHVPRRARPALARASTDSKLVFVTLGARRCAPCLAHIHLRRRHGLPRAGISITRAAAAGGAAAPGSDVPGEPERRSAHAQKGGATGHSAPGLLRLPLTRHELSAPSTRPSGAPSEGQPSRVASGDAAGGQRERHASRGGSGGGSNRWTRGDAQPGGRLTAQAGGGGAAWPHLRGSQLGRRGFSGIAVAAAAITRG